VMRVMPRLQKLVSSVRSGRNHCGRVVGNSELIGKVLVNVVTGRGAFGCKARGSFHLRREKTSFILLGDRGLADLDSFIISN
jgi:hypothetical protein